MNVKNTLFARLRKLLRVRFQIDTAKVTPDSTLGGPPIGFGVLFIRSEFRSRLNAWFVDLIEPFPTVAWTDATALADVVKAITGRAKIKTASEYRQHVATATGVGFDAAAGAGSQAVPIQSRPRVRDELNRALETLLLRNASLDDLANDRPVIIANLVDRMLV